MTGKLTLICSEPGCNRPAEHTDMSGVQAWCGRHSADVEPLMEILIELSNHSTEAALPANQKSYHTDLEGVKQAHAKATALLRSIRHDEVDGYTDFLVDNDPRNFLQYQYERHKALDEGKASG